LDGELKGEAPSVDQLERLPFLDAVINESLRIIPPVPVTWRLAADDLEIGGYEIPRGSEVYASLYHTHHMHDLYPRPESFDPSRWAAKSPSTYEYVPFGAGSRRCMGDGFAFQEMKVVLAMVLQRYRLACARPLTVDRFGFPVIRPKRGLPMVLQAQDREFGRGVGGIRGNVRQMVELPA
jgi:cytochrome P450